MKIKLFFVFLFSLSLIIHPLCNAQKLVKVRRGQFYQEKEGFREAWKAVRAGNAYFKKGPGTYREARENYLKAYNFDPTNPELNYMIGVCYLYTDDKFESIDYFKTAFKNKPKVSDDIHFMLGRAYHLIHDFDNAINEYTQYLNNLSPKLVVQKSAKIKLLIEQCKTGQELAAHPERVVINNLGVQVNSIYDEYDPVVANDDSILYFTSRRKYDKHSQRNPIDNKFYEDIYYTENKDGNWVRARRMDNVINRKKNKNNDAAIGISPDKKTLYLYVGKKNEGDLYYTTYKKGKWTSPRALSGKLNSKYRETSLSLSSDGKTLYFVSNDPKTSLGGADIYVSKKNSNDRWGKPVNIGNMINTPYDETAVSISPNDSILYFSSNGPNSMGGFDVFESKLSDVGLWSKPVNLGFPVNTPDDDLFYKVLPGGRTAYYSTIREGGIGGKDIYKIIYLGSEKEMMQSNQGYIIAGVTRPYDNIYFNPPAKIEIDTTILMKGIISDSENNAPIVAKIELVDPTISKSVATAISDSTGNYRIHIPGQRTYGVEIVAKGYLLYLGNVDLSNSSYDEVVVKNFALDRVEVGAKVILKNIFFEFGKSNLKPESYVELDNVVTLLENNETIRLEISGHTDNIGSLKSNTKLSEARAKSVVNYLVSKGINPSRLEYKGYAYTQPVAPNSTEAGRAQNRRVEFKVLSK